MSAVIRSVATVPCDIADRAFAIRRIGMTSTADAVSFLNCDFVKDCRLTWQCGARDVRASGHRKPLQHVADAIPAAENDCKQADPLFCFGNFEPRDGPVDRQMSRTRQHIVVTLTTLRRGTQPVGFLPHIADAVLAMTQRRLKTCPEAAVTLKLLVEDQGNIALGFRRKLNSEPQVRGASR